MGPNVAFEEVFAQVTIASGWFDGLAKWRRLEGARAARPVLVYGGDAANHDVANVMVAQGREHVLKSIEHVGDSPARGERRGPGP